MLMPFGKHAGEPVETIPPDYLRWCLANVKDLSPSLRQAICKAIGRPVPTTSQDLRSIDAKAEERLKDWYRRASRKCHPDHGGSGVFAEIREGK
jgi:hypothetical protein